MIENISKLKSLSYDKQLAFAYLTCERLYPNYIFFSRRFDFGNELILRSAIDFIYKTLLADNQPTQEIVNHHLTEVEFNTPDTEDFDTIFVSSALDSCTSISDTLDFMLDRAVSRLENISSYSTDTVYMFIQERDNMDFNNNSLFDEIISDDPLMQREVKIQKGIISYLSSIEKLTLSDIMNLLDLQKNDDKSNIDL